MLIVPPHRAAEIRREAEAVAAEYREALNVPRVLARILDIGLHERTHGTLFPKRAVFLDHRTYRAERPTDHSCYATAWLLMTRNSQEAWRDWPLHSRLFALTYERGANENTPKLPAGVTRFRRAGEYPIVVPTAYAERIHELAAVWRRSAEATLEAVLGAGMNCHIDLVRAIDAEQRPNN